MINVYLHEGELENLKEKAKQIEKEHQMFGSTARKSSFTVRVVGFTDMMTSLELQDTMRRLAQGEKLDAVVKYPDVGLKGQISDTKQYGSLFKRKASNFSAREWDYVLKHFGKTDLDEYTMVRVKISLLDVLKLEDKPVKKAPSKPSATSDDDKK